MYAIIKFLPRADDPSGHHFAGWLTKTLRNFPSDESQIRAVVADDDPRVSMWLGPDPDPAESAEPAVKPAQDWNRTRAIREVLDAVAETIGPDSDTPSFSAGVLALASDLIGADVDTIEQYVSARRMLRDQTDIEDL